MPRKKNLANHMINHEFSGQKKEFFVMNILKNNGFNVFNRVIIKDGRFKQKKGYREYDIKCSLGKFDCIFEVDGEHSHGDLENPTKNTIKRNADFERAHLNYSVINLSSIKGIRQLMQSDGKLSGANDDELIEFLTSYLIWHEYSKHKAKIEAGMMFV